MLEGSRHRERGVCLIKDVYATIDRSPVSPLVAHCDPLDVLRLGRMTWQWWMSTRRRYVRAEYRM